MTIQQCDAQKQCHALLVEKKLLEPKSKYVCGWRGAYTVENCPRLGRFTEEEEKGETCKS